MIAIKITTGLTNSHIIQKNVKQLVGIFNQVLSILIKSFKIIVSGSPGLIVCLRALTFLCIRHSRLDCMNSLDCIPTNNRQCHMDNLRFQHERLPSNITQTLQQWQIEAF